MSIMKVTLLATRPQRTQPQGTLRAFLQEITHYFGWTGPRLSLDTACSSSSVEIHQACRAIISGECTAALAGGVGIMTNPDWYYNLDGASFFKPNGTM